MVQDLVNRVLQECNQKLIIIVYELLKKVLRFQLKLIVLLIL